jgi:hypothetical protein
MVEEVVGMVEASVVGMVEASVVGMVEASAVEAAISLVAVVISLGIVLPAIASQNTEEGISSTGIASSTEIVSGTIAISFLEVPFCMITPTTGMIIRTTGMIIRTGTTDIRTIDRTTAFAVSWFQSGRRALPSVARSTIRH